MKRFLCMYFPAWVESLAARSLQPSVQEPPDARRNFKTLYRLVLWALKFSPLAALDEELVTAYRRRELPDLNPLHYGITLETSGTERIHRSEENLIQKILYELSQSGIKTRIAAAPTAGAAWAFSRYAAQPVSMTTQQDLLTELGKLPIEALRIKPGELSVFHQLGIRQIKQLLGLSPESLTARFGAGIVSRIAQALGHRPEMLHFIHPRLAFSISRSFDIPLFDVEAVKQALMVQLRELLARLKHQSKKAGSFVIELRMLSETQRKIVRSKELTLYSATHDLTFVSSVLESQLESFGACGPVDLLRIGARNIETAGNIQNAFIQKASDRTSGLQDELLNNFVIRLGKNAVRQAAFNQSHVPERSFSFLPLDKKYSARVENFSFGQNLERPSCFFRPPQLLTVTALLPDHPPARIRWQGREYRIICGSGPEKICAEWWREKIIPENENNLPEREYFRIQDEIGRWLWVFRDRRQQWYVQGVWI